MRYYVNFNVKLVSQALIQTKKATEFYKVAHFILLSTKIYL